VTFDKAMKGNFRATPLQDIFNTHINIMPHPTTAGVGLFLNKSLPESSEYLG